MDIFTGGIRCNSSWRVIEIVPMMLQVDDRETFTLRQTPLDLTIPEALLCDGKSAATVKSCHGLGEYL